MVLLVLWVLLEVVGHQCQSQAVTTSGFEAMAAVDGGGSCQVWAGVSASENGSLVAWVLH